MEHDESILERMDEMLDEYDSRFEDHIHHTCHMGVVSILQIYTECFIIPLKIPLQVLYEIPIDYIHQYANEMITILPGQSQYLISTQLHIIKILENKLIRTAVIQTYWIRLIQRHWKKRCVLKKKEWKEYGHVYSLKEREIKRIRKPMLSIRGLLLDYVRS